MVNACKDAEAKQQQSMGGRDVEYMRLQVVQCTSAMERVNNAKSTHQFDVAIGGLVEITLAAWDRMQTCSNHGVFLKTAALMLQARVQVQGRGTLLGGKSVSFGAARYMSTTMLHPHIYIFIYLLRQVGPLLVVKGDSSSRPQVHSSNKPAEAHHCLVVSL